MEYRVSGNSDTVETYSACLPCSDSAGPSATEMKWIRSIIKCICIDSILIIYSTLVNTICRKIMTMKNTLLDGPKIYIYIYIPPYNPEDSCNFILLCIFRELRLDPLRCFSFQFSPGKQLISLSQVATLTLR